MAEQDQQGPELVRFPAELDFVHLSSVRFTAHSEPIFLEEGESKKLIPDSWRISFECDKVADDKYLGKMTVAAEFTGETHEQKTGEQDAKEEAAEPPYEFDVTLTAGIRITRAVAEEFVNRWLREGIQYLIFPYVRATISELLSPTGFPRPYFPLLGVPILYREAPGPEDTDTKE